MCHVGMRYNAASALKWLHPAVLPFILICCPQTSFNQSPGRYATRFSVATAAKPRTTGGLVTGSDVVVQSLVNHGVEVIFAYPGGASMPLHQSLTRFKDRMRTILPRHEQGGAFAAQGYARTTGKPGVCMATSGPGATEPGHGHRRRQDGQHSADRASPARWAPP